MKEVLSNGFKAMCPYCGCGCTLLLKSNQSDIVEKTLPDKTDFISEGKPCLKGLTVHEMLSANRLQSPMIRKSKKDKLRPCSWEEAYEFIKENIYRVFSSNSTKKEGIDLGTLRDKVYFLGSGESTNEANYLLSKMCRSVFASNNIDSCARLCHAATGVAFGKMFGVKAIPNYCMDDVKEADAFFFMGTDPMEDYPVLFNRVLEAKRNGAKIVSVDVSANSTTLQSDRFVRIAPTGILPFLAHLINKFIEGKDYSRDAKDMEGFKDFVDSMKIIARENPLSTVGVSRDDLDSVYSIINSAKKTVFGFGMGLTQHSNGVDNVLAISGLSLLLNGILFPNRGKVNVQGAGDMGSDPTWRPNTEAVKKIGDWDLSFLTHKGKFSTHSLYENDVKILWMMGSNPSQSMPHLNLLDESFKKKFIIYQHHHVGRSQEFADVVLPSLVVTESLGSITNGERRVRGFYRSLNRKNAMGGSGAGNGLVDTKSLAKSDFEIIKDFAKFMKFKGFDYKFEEDVFKEILAIVDEYKNVSINEVVKEVGQLANKEPLRKVFIPIKYKKESFKGEGEYPFIFTTARSKYHFCTGEGTRSSKTLVNMESEGLVRISKVDAELLYLKNGDRIKIISDVGEIEAKITIDSSLEKRVLVAPYHFEKLLVNKLTPLKLDPVSATPCYKKIPVRIELMSSRLK